MTASLIFIITSLLAQSAAKPVPVRWEDGDYASPDGKYIAHLASDTAAPCLWIYRAALNRKRLPHSKPTLDEICDVDGVAWVPAQGHTLVFATSSIYGSAALGLWRGGSHFRHLVKVRHPNAENFQLRAVSRNGRILTYLHGLKENQTEDQYMRRSLKLPKL